MKKAVSSDPRLYKVKEAPARKASNTKMESIPSAISNDDESS
jgi:hypothetical protein